MELSKIEVSLLVVPIKWKKSDSQSYWIADKPRTQTDTVQICKEAVNKVGHYYPARIDYVYTGNIRWTLYSVYLTVLS
jgi:hypothetical protein